MVQVLTVSNKPSIVKFKHVCTDFPNITILTKSSTLGEVQVTFYHVTIGETVTSFTLAGYPKSLTVFVIDIEQALSSASNKICLPIIEVLLFAAARKLARLKNICNWVTMNIVLLPPCLIKAVILDGLLD